MSIVAVTLYQAVLAFHVMAVLLAYGLPLTVPFVLPYLRRVHPRAMPGVHDVQHRLNQRLATPASIVIFVLGATMATKRSLWTEPWVDSAVTLFAVISLTGATYIVPSCRKLAELAQTDVDASPNDQPVSWSPPYDTRFKQYVAVESLLGASVLTAIFFMAAKPFS
jgi:hypothetical protein